MAVAPTQAVPVQLDHLVVVAASLEAGVAWCEATLGVSPGPGGRHALMGTHNRLLRVSSPTFAQAYLEVIAIDPAAPPPLRPRWFGMDTPWRGSPRLVHCVLSTPALQATRQRLLHVGLDPGEPVAVERPSPAGTLRWRLTVPADGQLRLGGALPTFIEWPPGMHPSAHMPASGVVLKSLVLRGFPAAASAELTDVLSGSGVRLEAGPGPALSAELNTPQSTITLNSTVEQFQP
jgi:hypothetical protein